MNKEKVYKNKLIVFLSGGTGNQLFQLFTSISLSIDNNIILTQFLN